MAIVVASYVVLGSVMGFLFANYWEGEKADLLAQNAYSVAALASGYTTYSEEQEGYVINYPSLSVFIEMIAVNIDSDIFVTDGYGNVLMGVYPSSGITVSTSTQIDSALVESAMAGMVEIRTSFDATYDSLYFTVGIPFQITTESGEIATVGAVFVATDSLSFFEYQVTVFKLFFLAVFSTLILTFFVVWGFTYRMVKPLRLMSKAAREFGDGNFSVRVPVTTEDEIGDLGVSFNNMANSLANSEGMRRSFIANVSHELKTPMTTIAGFIDGILDGTIPYSKQNHYLSIVSTETKRLSRLVKSMLDLSRIDSGEMKLNPVKFDLTDKVFTTLLTFEKKIEEKEIEIRCSEDLPPLNITGDQDLMHQVVYNLVENAVKFTNQGGYIAIGLTDSVDRVFVSIENSGMGIPADEINDVFDKFYKTDKSRSHDKNGLGLGLYLVRTIIKLHGGDITVKSVENSYCTFEFYIPKPREMSRPIDSVISLSDKATDTDVQDVE